MLILLDQDNVLADFESGFRRHWRNRFGEDAPIEGKEHLFYIRDRLPEHLQAYAAELYGTVGFFESLPPVSGAVEAAHTDVDDPGGHGGAVVVGGQGRLSQ